VPFDRQQICIFLPEEEADQRRWERIENVAGDVVLHHGDQCPRHHLSFGTRRILTALDGTRQRFGVGHMRGQQGFPNA
jgi:hypothetical protein